MKTVTYDVKFEEKAGRLELFIRWLWAIPTYVVLVLLVILAYIAMLVQFFHILLLGKRNNTLTDWTKMYLAYQIKFMSYFLMLTDERNPIFPES